jgi:hypothetical protein
MWDKDKVEREYRKKREIGKEKIRKKRKGEKGKKKKGNMDILLFWTTGRNCFTKRSKKTALTPQVNLLYR